MGGGDGLILLVEDNKDDEALTLRAFRKNNLKYVRKPRDFNEFVAAVTQLGCYRLVLNETPRGR